MLEMKNGFTIIELLVAMGLLVAIMIGSSVVFYMSVDAKRTADATAEITQKLHAITSQLNADLRGLRADGEIVMVWAPEEVADIYQPDDHDGDGYVRFDRLMFFADGDFQSYKQWFVGTDTNDDGFVDPGEVVKEKVLVGNVARVCYMIAKDKNDMLAQAKPPEKRILARTQHILTSESIAIDTDDDGVLDYWSDFPDPTTFAVPDPDPDTNAYDNDVFEYDTKTIQEWLNFTTIDKENMLSVVIGMKVIIPIPTIIIAYGKMPDGSTITDGGAIADGAEPDSIHTLFCEGVGEFKVQIWSEAFGRWYPEISGGDFILSDIAKDIYPGLLYQGTGDVTVFPGPGRAVKFTFTLYDSLGIFKEGKTFTHIVYLDN